ncbi:MAG TPA: hypothetical protein VK206_26225 [Anaerolineales bacterium]|nr:hypothetical protein [Anaerolineales bacterium]
MTDSLNPIEAGEIRDSETAISQVNDIALNNHAVMLKEIRSWGLWSLGLGVLHIVSSGFLSAPWGILLFIVGLASFYFQTASMFIIYAITLAWAALSNFTGFQIGWVLFALFQLYLSFRVFKQYRRFRDVETTYLKTITDDAVVNKPSPNQAARYFPWTGAIVGCSSIIGLFFIFLYVAWVVISGRSEDASHIPVPLYIAFMKDLIVNLGVIGFAVGIASLLSQYRPKALAIIAMVTGVIAVVFDIFLF